MKVVIIVQARMASTRLPGKVLKEVLQKPLLEYQIERLRRVTKADEIVIATTVNSSDGPIVSFCERLQIPFFRGPEDDVLTRYYEAAKVHNADVVVRITSDCPLIDPHVVNDVIVYYLDHSARYDYVTNALEPTYPRGMDVEVFPFAILKEAFLEATVRHDREHVTSFIYMNSQRYRLGNIRCRERQGHHRWTVDTPEDFELTKRIIEHLYPYKPEFTFEDTLELFSRYPELYAINADIKQKEYGE